MSAVTGITSTTAIGGNQNHSKKFRINFLTADIDFKLHPKSDVKKLSNHLGFTNKVYLNSDDLTSVLTPDKSVGYIHIFDKYNIPIIFVACNIGSNIAKGEIGMNSLHRLTFGFNMGDEVVVFPGLPGKVGYEDTKQSNVIKSDVSIAGVDVETSTLETIAWIEATWEILVDSNMEVSRKYVTIDNLNSKFTSVFASHVLYDGQKIVLAYQMTPEERVASRPDELIGYFTIEIKKMWVYDLIDKSDLKSSAISDDSKSKNLLENQLPKVKPKSFGMVTPGMTFLEFISTPITHRVKELLIKIPKIAIKERFAFPFIHPCHGELNVGNNNLNNVANGVTSNIIPKSIINQDYDKLESLVSNMKLNLTQFELAVKRGGIEYVVENSSLLQKDLHLLLNQFKYLPFTSPDGKDDKDNKNTGVVSVLNLSCQPTVNSVVDTVSISNPSSLPTVALTTLKTCDKQN